MTMPFYQSEIATLHNGDCLEVLPTLPDASVDLILTDPPYFRAKALDWDRQWPSADVWAFGTVHAYPGKHPCEKPLDLLTHAICASSRPGGVVLDAFAGGGSCARAALLSGRRWIGIERDPKWCAAAAAVCADPSAPKRRRCRVSRPACGSTT